MNLRRIRQITCATLLLCAATCSAFAQNARFSGQVTDPQNAAIPGAQVQVVNEDTLAQVQTKTDATGTYTIPYLPAGRYKIEVDAQGFNASVHSVNLGMGQAFVYNIQLTVGGASSTVEVNSNSEVTQVNTTNAEISGTITGKEVAAIQLNGRNYTQLLTLTAGVSNQTGQDEALVGGLGSVAFSVDGGRTEYNSFQVDGSETLNTGINKDKSTLIVTPSIDAVQEIKVLTSNYGAQYPSTGNGTTLVTTKSGSDTFHGSLYEFVRNEMFNAKGYFDVGDRAPLYRRNDFGGTIGGPVIIPHLYNGKGKTHFFFSEEARLDKSPTAFRRGVPSLAERSGDFSDVCPFAAAGQQVPLDTNKYPDCPRGSGFYGSNVPFTGTPTLPGNNLVYDLGNVNSGEGILAPDALAILNTGIIPAPNATSGCNSSIHSCYNTEVSLPTYFREELFRIDHTINDKTRATFRYIHDEWDTTQPTPQFPFAQNSFPTIQNRFYGPGLSMVARVTEVFTPTFLNEIVVSYTDSFITLSDRPGPGANLQRPDVLNENFPAPMGYIFNNGFEGKIPGIIIGGNNAAYGGYGFTADTSYMPWEHSNPTYSIADNLTKVVGRHNLQFGAQLVLFQRNQVNGPIGAATGDTQGLLTFSNESSRATSGNAFADFLSSFVTTLGTQNAIANYQQDSGQARYNQRYKIAEPYFQDDWKATSHLTINMGVRLSLFGTFYEKNHNAYNWVSSSFKQTAQVDPTTGILLGAGGVATPLFLPNGGVNPAVLPGIVHCGANGVPAGCMTGHLFNPAPRVGFAWDVLGNGKLSLRGGYGIFYEHGTGDEANTGSLEGSSPLVLSATQYSPTNWGCIGDQNSSCFNFNAGQVTQPLGIGFPVNLTSIPTKAVWPYVQQWSASVERQLPWSSLATFAYVGSKGTHLTTELQSNQLPPAVANPFGPHQPFLTRFCETQASPNNTAAGDGAGYNSNGGYALPGGTFIAKTSPSYVNIEAACYGNGAQRYQSPQVDPNSLRSYAPGLGQIYSLQNVATSNYNAFQATLRRTQGPLFVGVSYTYSHSLDDASDRSDTTFVNSYDLRGNRASSNYDQRHLLHISYVYDFSLLRPWRRFASKLSRDPSPVADPAKNPPPSASGGSAIAKSLLNGWEFSGVTLFETGTPFTVVNGGSANGVGVLDNAGVANGVGAGSYPDLVGNAHGSHANVSGNSTVFGPLLLNPGAFAAPRGLTFGNAGRNVLNNPSRTNFDMALQKSFPIGWHESNFVFRAEAFNTFNHTQFRIYDPLLGNQANNTVSCYASSAAAGYSAAGGDGTDCLTGNSFLHPVDAHRPRTLQFALKYEF